MEVHKNVQSNQSYAMSTPVSSVLVRVFEVVARRSARLEHGVDMTTARAHALLSLIPHHDHQTRNLRRGDIGIAQGIDDVGLLLREVPVARESRWRGRRRDRCICISCRLSSRVRERFFDVCLRYA
jgi:hypothetical protein